MERPFGCKSIMERQELIQYIYRLNERTISRKSSSGFTSWAIAAAIVYLLIDIIKSFPYVLSIEDGITWFVVELALTGNLCILFIHFISGLFLSSYISKHRRILSTNIFVVISISFTYLFMALINIHATFIAYYYKLPYLLFSIFGMYSLLNGILITTGRIKEYRERIINKMDVCRISTPRQRTIIGINIVVIVACILSIPSLHNLFTTIVHQHTYLQLSKISILSVEIILTVILSVIFSSNIGESEKDHWLIELERSIHLDDLTVDEIKDKLISPYFGIDVTSWIQSRKKKLLSIKEQFEDTAKRVQAVLAEKAIQETSSIEEVTKRISELGKETSSIYNKIVESIDKIRAEIMFFLKTNDFEKYELKEIGVLVETFENTVEEIDNMADMVQSILNQSRENLKQNQN